MLVTGTVPAVLEGVVRHVVVGVVEKLRAAATGEGGVDEGELYFRDFGALGLGMGGKEGKRRGRVVDGVRKVVLSEGEGPGGRGDREVGGLKLRSCARCGTVMEDLLPVKGASPWMMNLQRTCFCGGFWMV